MSANPHAIAERVRRLWQPRRGLFWLMLAFNALSSVLGWTLHWVQPTGALLVMLTLFALANALMGWWLLSILWREGVARSSRENPHVQSIADQQNR
ncbi:MAG: hypothetical protein WEK74_04840 [Hydrogenophaga sp.]